LVPIFPSTPAFLLSSLLLLLLLLSLFFGILTLYSYSFLFDKVTNSRRGGTLITTHTPPRFKAKSRPRTSFYPASAPPPRTPRNGHKDDIHQRVRLSLTHNTSRTAPRPTDLRRDLSSPLPKAPNLAAPLMLWPPYALRALSLSLSTSSKYHP